MATEDFIQSNPMDFTNSPPEPETPLANSKEANNNSFYASMLSGGDVVSKFTESMNQYLMEGQSGLVKDITTVIQNDEDKQRATAISGILSDETVPIEQRKKIVNDYINQKTIPVDLRTKYAEKVAANNTGYDGLSPEEFSNAFYAKEKASEEIQKEINKYSRDLNPSEGKAFLGSLLEFVPFIGSFGKNYDLTQLSKAISEDNTSYVKNFFLGGEARKEIKDKLIGLAPQERKEAFGRVIEKLKNTEGFDYSRYRDLEDVVQSEDYGTVSRVIDDVFGLFDVGLGGYLIKKGAKPFIPELKTRPKSPIGTTAVHNPESASKLGTAAIVDESGRVAEALGEDKAKILADMFFTKVNEETLTGLPSGIRKEVDKLTSEGVRGFSRSETTPFLYGQAVRDSVKESIYDTIQNFKAASYHQSKSIIDETDEYVKGIATFGKAEDKPFTKLVEAEEKLAQMETQIPHGSLELVKVDPDTMKIVPVTARYPEGEFYIQWKYAHTYNPGDAQKFGPVSVSLNVPFVNKSIPTIDKALTAVARTPVVGRFLFPATHYLDEWITRGALFAGDAHLALEQPVLKQVQAAVGSLSRLKGEKKALGELVELGSDEARVISYGEISQRLGSKGFNQKQIDKVAEAYFLNRRADDLAYLFTNRKTVEDFSRRGMKELYIQPGKAIYAKPLTTAPEIKAVWDEAAKQIRPISRKELEELYQQGGSVGELAERISVGSKYSHHVLIPSGTKAGKLSDFILPRIPGHSPRYWQEYYFLQRTPLKAEVDGHELDIVNPKHTRAFESLRSVHAAAGTKDDIVKLMQEMQKKHPEFKWEWRRERTDSNTLVTDYNIYKEQLSHSMKRGDKLISIDGHARLEDPIVARYRSIKSVSRYAAFNEWAETFRTGFVKTYGEYLVEPGRFPKHITDLRKPMNASDQELKNYKDAVAHFSFYQAQMQNRTWSEELWKEGMYAFGESLEKVSEGLAGLFKTIGKEWYPPAVLRSMAFTAFMALRPIRQLFLQSSQILQYTFLDPQYMANPNGWFREITALTHGMTSISTPVQKLEKKFLSTLSKNEQALVDGNLEIGARILGTSVEEYKKILFAFKDSGLVSSVDTNLLANGLFNQGTRALNESVTESIAKNIYASVTAVPKLGKTIGMDAGEVVNLMSAWLFARQRHMRIKPDIPWDSKIGLESISVDARQISGEMTRGGEVSWQRGFFALPFQFLAMPYKTMLGLFTSKVFTPAEKSRMIAGNLVTFGAAGLGVSSMVDKLREHYGDAGTSDMWMAIKGGLFDLGGNHALNLMLDEKEKEPNMLALSKSFSPVGDNIIPFSDVMSNLQEKPFQTVLMGPGWSLFDGAKGRIPQAWRDISSIWATKELDTTDKIRRSMFEAAEVAAGGTDWMKYQLAQRTGHIISSTGHDTGLHADRKSMIGNILGIQTYTEVDYYKIQERMFDETKEVKDAAKYLVNVVEQNSLKYGTDEWDKQNSLVQSYMSFIADNPDLEMKMGREIKSIQNQLAKNQGENAYIRIYNHALTLSQEDRKTLSNTLRSSTDERMRELADKLNELTGIEAY